MRSKLFRIFSIMMILSMIAVPVSAKPAPPDPSVDFQAAEAYPVYGVDGKLDQRGVINEVKGATGPARYIVQLQAPAAASYAGGIKDLAPTQPSAIGEIKFDAKSPAVQAYREFLLAEQAQTISRIGELLGRSISVLFQYDLVLNGFTTELSPSEAAQVAQLAEVRRVFRDVEEKLDTDAGPAWIGAPGIWDGSTTGLTGTKGEGVIVGILDSGINHDHPSFAEVGPADMYVHINPKGPNVHLGWCDPANTNYIPGFCNEKLIGAWDFVDGLTPPSGYEVIGPEDGDGHGSHTASTTAGNTVDAGLVAPTLTFTQTISGVAPHANIIAYDVCYYSPADATGLCPSSSSLAAANQALADGVDVINYSIGGGNNPYSDSVELAFLDLFNAGVFVSTSAGNSGPGANTTGHRSPWVSTSAAATHDRIIWNHLIDMVGGTPPADMQGKGFTAGYGPAPIVHAKNYQVAPATAEDARLCAPGAFPAGTFNGEIVVCDRGIYARVDKAQSAADGGAGGFVLANAAANGEDITGDAYAIPGVHLGFSNAEPLRLWLDTMAVGQVYTATIAGVDYTKVDTNGDVLAGFSSRGPNGSLDVLNPKVTTPGVDIWAAVATDFINGPAGYPEYAFYSGTSMASPHTAGAAALFKAAFPTWSPAEILSAFMSTSDTTVTDTDGSVADYFDMGAGRVDLSMAGKAGLVMDETGANMLAADPGLGGDVKTLNIASFTNSQCLQNCSWTRVVSNPLAVPVTWTGSADQTWLSVDPISFTIAAGGTQTILVTADVTAEPKNDWVFGTLTFTPDVASTVPAHFPVTVIPSTGVFPTEVTINTRRNAGSQELIGLQALEITDLSTVLYGLAKADRTTAMLPQDSANGEVYDDPTDGATWITTTVMANAVRLVAEIVESEAPDVDLFVGLDANGDGIPQESEQVCASATGVWQEYCDLSAPAAGVYWILFQNWESSAPGATDRIVLASAVVPGSSAGNWMVDGPSAVPELDLFDLTITWDLMDAMAGDRYYGVFDFGSDPANPDNIGRVSVDLVRFPDDVGKAATPDSGIVAGDTVTFTVTIQPNVTPTDLNYSVIDAIPAGTTLIPGSVSISEGTYGVVGNYIYWNVDRLKPTFGYDISTSASDPLCDTGFGGYVDLAGFGISPNAGVSGDTKVYTTFSTGDPINFYGQSYTGASFTDDGFVIFNQAANYGGAPWTAQAIPDPALPNNLLAALWDDFEIFYSAPPTNTGVSLATAGPNTFVIEYDNIEFYSGSADNFDFEIVGSRAVSDAPGDYEYVVAYDNLNGDLSGNNVTIGVENASGTAGSALVNAGDVSSVISDGFMVCYDWQAQGVTPVTLTYQVKVNSNVYPGTTLTNIVSHVTNNPGDKVATTEFNLFIGLTTYLPFIAMP
jgi:uncharacterized repeat protein (TIGR01451 family)